jgi:23S rRNA C2498 (ribose-2'-O)-methylase RlmM
MGDLRAVAERSKQIEVFSRPGRESPMIKNMNDVSVSREIFARYKRLQQYVGWTCDDARRVAELKELLEPIFPELVDDFYDAVAREPDA